jgi:hypothetical protein
MMSRSTSASRASRLSCVLSARLLVTASARPARRCTARRSPRDRPDPRVLERYGSCHTGLSEQQGVLSSFDESSCGEVEHLRLRHLRIEMEVESSNVFWGSSRDPRRAHPAASRTRYGLKPTTLKPGGQDVAGRGDTLRFRDEDRSLRRDQRLHRDYYSAKRRHSAAGDWSPSPSSWRTPSSSRHKSN